MNDTRIIFGIRIEIQNSLLIKVDTFEFSLLDISVHVRDWHESILNPLSLFPASFDQNQNHFLLQPTSNSMEMKSMENIGNLYMKFVYEGKSESNFPKQCKKLHRKHSCLISACRLYPLSLRLSFKDVINR